MDAVNYISDVLQKTKGKELKVAFLGGSLSKGERVKRELCFVSLFEQKIEEKLSNGRKVSVLRYGQSGTMSSNGLYKVKELIEEKPDLVFLDYAIPSQRESVRISEPLPHPRKAGVQIFRYRQSSAIGVSASICHSLP